MKKFIVGVLACLTVFGTQAQVREPSAAGEESAYARFRRSMIPLTDYLAELELEKNRLVFEKYLEAVETGEKVPPLFQPAYRGLVLRYEREVPELKRNREAFEAADEELLRLLETDSVYASVRRLLETVGPGRLQDSLCRIRYKVYERMDRESPRYQVLRRERDEALRRANTATLRYMVEDFHRRGVPFPESMVTPDDYRVMNLYPALNLVNNYIYTVEEKIKEKHREFVDSLVR